MVGGIGAIADWWPIKVSCCPQNPQTQKFIFAEYFVGTDDNICLCCSRQAYRPCPALTQAGMDYNRCTRDAPCTT